MIRYLGILVIIALGFSGCNNETDKQSNGQSSSSLQQINQMTTQRIEFKSTNATSSDNTIASDYFLAPLTYYSTLGNIQDETQSDINNDGFNYYVNANMFETSYKSMKLDLIYNSEDSRDYFNNIFGLWRTSFTSYIDFAIDYDGANIKTALYDTPKEACEVGFDDIKETLHRGILSEAYTTYNELNHKCIINGSEGELGSFPVFSKTYGVVGDYHYLTKPSGQTLVFEKEGDNTYVSYDRGIKVELIVSDNGTYEYIDADGYKNIYNSDGKLIEMTNEGQTTTINYDDRYKITDVQGPNGTYLNYSYDDTERLVSITDGAKSVLFGYDGLNRLSAVNVKTDKYIESDDNSTETTECELDNATRTEYENSYNNRDQYHFLSFEYNDKDLLTNIITPELKNIDGTILAPSINTEYTYDSLNRVIKIGDEQTFIYNSNIVTIKNGDSTIIRNLLYKKGMQHIQDVITDESTLNNTYNDNGQLATITLSEEPDTDENGNIITQGLENGKKVFKGQFTYNERGLLNHIQFSSLSSGNTFVKLDYKSRYPKPTKILTEEEATFLDYGTNGELIHKTGIKLNKAMKLRANTLTYNDISSNTNRFEKTFTYDEEGLLIASKNIVKNATQNYTIDANGIAQKQQRLKSNFIWIWSPAWEERGLASPASIINANNDDSYVAFVGGAADQTLSSRVKNYATFSHISKDSCSYYTWDQIDTNSFFGFADLFNGGYTEDLEDNGKDYLISVGHSWGGDSIMENQGDSDVIVTVDPVGTHMNADPKAYWIELYAMSGTPKGEYTSWIQHLDAISFSVPFISCSGWFRCSLKWRRVTIYLWIPWPVKHETLVWNPSDWLAYAGGKGSFSSYDPGEQHPDKLITMPAHHEDFGYMIWMMEKNYSSYDFGLTDKYFRGLDGNILDNTIQSNSKKGSYESLKSTYNKKEKAYQTASDVLTD